MLKMWIYSSIFSAMVAGMWWGITKFYEPKGTSSQTPITVTAEELTTAYASDPVAANKTYGNKLVEITGIVGVGTLNNDGYSLLLNGYIYDVDCEFIDDTEILNVSLLIPGDEVTIIGKVVGVSLVYIMINNCTLKNVR